MKFSQMPEFKNVGGSFSYISTKRIGLLFSIKVLPCSQVVLISLEAANVKIAMFLGDLPLSSIIYWIL